MYYLPSKKGISLYEKKGSEFIDEGGKRKGLIWILIVRKH